MQSGTIVCVLILQIVTLCYLLRLNRKFNESKRLSRLGKELGEATEHLADALDAHSQQQQTTKNER